MGGKKIKKKLKSFPIGRVRTHLHEIRIQWVKKKKRKKKEEEGSKKLTFIWEKKKDLNFTFQHTFIWEGKKKKNTSNTRSFGRGEKAGKRNFQHTCLFGREKNKKEIEKLSNWQG